MRFAKWKNRTEGEEAPYIPFGPFKIRLPFIHYRFEWPDYIQGLLLLPIVTLVEPILGVALALTLLIQGYVNVKVGVLEARSQTDLGIAGVVAAILCIKGASWAFGAGILLCLLIYGKNFFKGSVDDTFTKDQKNIPSKNSSLTSQKEKP